ncbi:3-oxoadipate CoA-transferase subunit B [Symmachiella macrocystis]|uniref:3-oxoadipate CoA-transferase subunit B n=1 Tax=Symmachiella macrocystis TaxID=2527985 RepID=A0A5C6B556_9PLAN|nr:CoA-transferase [Symmachiella macrocystis]TWU06621.1 3-oxoadipate CoA-transferase subunit B [Symmachiella macrocystis]
MTTKTYTPIEQMICTAAGLLEDGALVVVGTGAPCAAAMLAQLTTAPKLTLMFEAGGVGPRLPRMPISVGDSRTFYQGLMATSMADIMETCQRGMVDYTFLGGAQIDRYGNLNSTVIGDYDTPAVRLPGSGGANDLGSLCRKTLVITPHDPRRFVERVDYVTTAGYLDGPGAREAAGLPPGTGPHKVITDLAILGFHPDTKRMQVESLHPGVTLEAVRSRTSFDIDVAEQLATTALPTSDQLDALRDQVDPHGYIIGRSL